jgi:hypothetical protein
MLDQCCGGDTAYLLLQINIICLLLALIGVAAIIMHPAWCQRAPRKRLSRSDKRWPTNQSTRYFCALATRPARSWRKPS